MRLARIIGALVALILTASLGQALVAPADALAKPEHSIKGLRGDEVGHTNRFFIKGKVATFPKGKIRVLRNVAGGRYELYKKTRTRSSGKFRTAIYQVGRKKTCFKIQVPATSGYRKTTSRVIGCIETG
jgi:hypothetical protein